MVTDLHQNRAVHGHTEEKLDTYLDYNSKIDGNNHYWYGMILQINILAVQFTFNFQLFSVVGMNNIKLGKPVSRDSMDDGLCCLNYWFRKLSKNFCLWNIQISMHCGLMYN